MQAAASNLSHSHKGDPCLVLTADPKPRLRWTQDLHERFVDAVTQLGGASSESLLSLPLSKLVQFSFCGNCKKKKKIFFFIWGGFV